jgi:mannan endo-1,4-beta-mannosidase
MHYKFREVMAAISLAASASAALADDGTGATLRASASGAAQDVYSYIATRPLMASNGLIAGQHLGGFNDLVPPVTFGEGFHGVADQGHPPVTRYPGLVGARYDALDKSATPPTYTLDPNYDTSINNALISDWRTYHSIAAITATPPNPWDTTAGRGPSGSDTPLSDLLHVNANVNPTVNARFWSEVQVIADGLEQLRDQGVPVVFRPFAEYNVGKYYGPDGYYMVNGVKTFQSASDFRALWADVWDYYVNQRHLDNLIFCWEAWVLGRNGPESKLQPWFPDPSTVDVVSGAYYFPAPTTNYFDASNGNALTLHDYTGTPPSLDLTTHTNLIGVAEAAGKPFGIAQWGLNYVNGDNCSSGGDANDALGFYNSVLSTTPPNRKRTAFVYHWVNLCAIEKQQNSSSFVSAAAVATADDVAQVVAIQASASGNPSGWVLEAAPQGSGVGGSVQTAPGPLRNGDTGANLRLRSIVTFDTSTIPASAVITSVALRMHLSSVSGAADPYGLFGPLSVDVVGTSAGLSTADFAQAVPPDTLNVATLTNPTADDLGWAQAPFSQAGIQHLNRTGVTRVRVLFTTASNGNGFANFLNWYSGDSSTANPDDKPQLVVSYHY